MTTTPTSTPATSGFPNVLDSIDAEPGGFGAGLGRLGFGPFAVEAGWQTVWVSDLPLAGGRTLRVRCFPEDGSAVSVESLVGGTAQLEEWSVRFSGDTPQAVVFAAVLAGR